MYMYMSRTISKINYYGNPSEKKNGGMFVRETTFTYLQNNFLEIVRPREKLKKERNERENVTGNITRIRNKYIVSSRGNKF